jgi:hypothetical protein
VVWSLIFVMPQNDPIKETQKAADAANFNLVLMAVYILIVAGLILSLVSLYSVVTADTGEQWALGGLVAGALSGLLVMADWGALALGTIAVADAYKDGNTGVAPALKYLEGGELPSQLDAIFGVAAVLALISAILFAIPMWRSRIFPRWVVIAFGLGLILFAASIPIVSHLGGICLAVSGFTMARALGHDEVAPAASPATMKTA